MPGGRQFAVLTGCMLLACRAAAYEYDPNDFAVEVVAYVQGSDVPQDVISGALFNDPNAALGRPTLKTTGDGFDIPLSTEVPVVPIGPAFRSFELVTVGNGGSLVLKFSHPVANDRNNPYGVDFIVYGNAWQKIRGGPVWRDGNPEDVVVMQTTYGDPGIVSVSRDGLTWHTFSDGPYADDFAPTAAYRWDAVNDTWAQELDPTRPVDPRLHVDGMNVAQMIDAYDGSAGGTGFDIGTLGLDWIQYVRIDDDPRFGSKTTEIDAVADVSSCGDYRHPFPAGDANYDCRVDLADLALMAANWLACTWRCP